MLDPFPPVPPSLAKLVAPLAARLDLATLPLHIHEVLLAAVFYHFCCAFLSPWLSPLLFPNTYKSLSARTRLNWDVHVVSLIQATGISALAIYVLAADPARRTHPQAADGIHASPIYAGQFLDAEHGLPDFRQRIWGYTGAAGLVQALGCGYFLWDLYISLRHLSVFGPGLLAHAVSALWVYGAGFRPFTVHYAPIFILYELSSPFLNVHWFCDKLRLTGSRVQLVNGIFLVATFFAARLVWGVYYSVAVFADVWHALRYQDTPQGRVWLRSAGKVPVEWWLAATYLAANLTLTTLNVVWFGKMIATLRARFPPPLGTKRDGPSLHDVKDGADVLAGTQTAGKEQIVVGRGVEYDGRRSVEVHATETSGGREVKGAASTRSRRRA